MLTVPATVPGITMATIILPLLEITIADLPPITTLVGELKFVPVIVTKVPTGPFSGENEVIVGAAANK